jgi:hypothetical protein
MDDLRRRAARAEDDAVKWRERVAAEKRVNAELLRRAQHWKVMMMNYS